MSKGKIKELSFGGAIKLSYNYQSMDGSFYITKEYDTTDDTIDWDKEKELLVKEVYELLGEEAQKIQENLVSISEAMKPSNKR